MKNFIVFLMATMMLLSCKKKEEQQTKPINKNFGTWYGVFDNETKQSTITINEKFMIIDNMNFNIIEIDDFFIRTMLYVDRVNYNTYNESTHNFHKDTLMINFVLRDNTVKRGKFVK
jgi:hypothetical protein